MSKANIKVAIEIINSREVVYALSIMSRMCKTISAEFEKLNGMRHEYEELCHRSIHPGLTLKEWRRRQELGKQIFETRKLKI